ncbi:DUF402 domain-containing protein [Herpetosiphon giganteus]|uniref:DUF402 domain-containing protein n=1 Tax=Herpetosiphon giganteus TaxID=2029754 RepID=UPI00195E5E02|nr:DUF402 domain-containing protein [Herpetosiphon giganteus]MBM7844893.1 hypothetical protein [Herpetosiphon giganteus]
MSLAAYPLMAIHGFKWPKRPTAQATGYLLGADQFGHWLGIAAGSAWQHSNGQQGMFEQAFVKLIPPNAYWSACFNLSDKLIDVDIVLPNQWHDQLVEEIDLEIDLLKMADGSIEIRDQAKFAAVCQRWPIPAAIIEQVHTTTAQIYQQLQAQVEPFKHVGARRLAQFLQHVAAEK